MRHRFKGNEIPHYDNLVYFLFHYLQLTAGLLIVQSVLTPLKKISVIT